MPAWATRPAPEEARPPRPDFPFAPKEHYELGEALGQTAGNAFRWKYTMALPVDGKVYEVQFDDWMYLMDDKTMLNKAVMSKYGIRLGEVTLSFTKPSVRSSSQTRPEQSTPPTKELSPPHK